MGYVSPEEAAEMSHDALVDAFLDKQEMARVAIRVALTHGGSRAEHEMRDEYACYQANKVLA